MKKRYVALIVVIMLLFSAFTFMTGLEIGSNRIGKLEYILWLIEEKFALDYDKEMLPEMTAEFMIYALGDPYSDYMSKGENTLFGEVMAGKYTGLGIMYEFDEESGRIIISEVVEGGPADKAGIKVGDIILSVDDIEANEENYEKIYYYIKGISDDAPGDDAELQFEILRDGAENIYKLKREEIKLENVKFEIIDEIIYIKITDFAENVPEELKKILEENEGFESIILDLRDNGGGDLDALLEISDMFLPKGLVLTTEDAKGVKTEYSVKDNEYYKEPMAVIVNGESASASEVLTAAIKEGGRGVVIGETTYGKGLVQSIIPLGDGSALRLTIEKYYTAKGNYINEVGVKPDIEIEDEEEQLKTAINSVREMNK